MIDKNKIVIRKANNDDNIEQIASLIYSSDINIYGAMFGDEICASNILNELIFKDKINISIKNLIVASYEKNIVGMLCFIEDDYFNDQNAYKSAYIKLGLTPPRYFDEVFNIYWQKIIKEDFTNLYYISNIAVDKNYQNLGIGKKILCYFKEIYNDKPIVLDVVRENVAAINAYKKSGFEIVENATTVSNLPIPFRMLCKKN